MCGLGVSTCFASLFSCPEVFILSFLFLSVVIFHFVVVVVIVGVVCCLFCFVYFVFFSFLFNEHLCMRKYALLLEPFSNIISDGDVIFFYTY